jgi:hypothetical protein
LLLISGKDALQQNEILYSRPGLHPLFIPEFLCSQIYNFPGPQRYMRFPGNHDSWGSSGNHTRIHKNESKEGNLMGSEVGASHPRRILKYVQEARGIALIVPI